MISGKSSLTDKIINRIQNYFGMAIRQNTSDCWNGDKVKALYNMKKSVLAVLWHCTNMTDSNNRHQFYPRINYSWCTFWGENKSHYIFSVNIPFMF